MLLIRVQQDNYFAQTSDISSESISVFAKNPFKITSFAQNLSS
ncbi:MAG: hypothetical protein ACJAUV_000233 [Flavobacteriales bacterium]|jgi:hypothetical protein